MFGRFKIEMIIILFAFPCDASRCTPYLEDDWHKLVSGVLMAVVGSSRLVEVYGVQVVSTLYHEASRRASTINIARQKPTPSTYVIIDCSGDSLHDPQRG